VIIVPGAGILLGFSQHQHRALPWYLPAAGRILRGHEIINKKADLSTLNSADLVRRLPGGRIFWAARCSLTLPEGHP